jgi:hypothetical protein
MTAQGKINASQVEIGHRIIVKVSYDPAGHMITSPSRTKTGQGVEIVRVIGKFKHSSKRGYMILTSLGSLNGFYAEPIQTMWLAPEDPAGRNRAHAEALRVVAQAEMDEATANQATPQYRHFAEATRIAGGYAGGMRALEIEAHAEHADRNWDRLSRNKFLAELALGLLVECQLCGGPLASDGVCADDGCGADDEDAAARETEQDRGAWYDQN